eukprot:GFKZ01008911.1.p1 GENE.GFKZ01008911.1~~GFKZ01008911.1.p1  ORF type:complete len:137 (+),score=16.15 GFKZ01008911.1:344-754(+)
MSSGDPRNINRSPAVTWYTPRPHAPSCEFQERRLTLAPGIPAPRESGSLSVSQKRWTSVESSSELSLRRSTGLPLEVEKEDWDGQQQEEEKRNFEPVATTAFVGSQGQEPLHRSVINALREWLRLPTLWFGTYNRG